MDILRSGLKIGQEEKEILIVINLCCNGRILRTFLIGKLPIFPHNDIVGIFLENTPRCHIGEKVGYFSTRKVRRILLVQRKLICFNGFNSFLY